MNPDVDEYITLMTDYTSQEDAAVKEVLADRMHHLWYFYLTPRDKKYILRLIDQINKEQKNGM